MNQSARQPERPLPHDPDLEVDEGPLGRPVPVHLRPAFIGLVALGGALGTLARFGVERLLGTSEGLPVGTLTVNLVGAFVLGALIEGLALRGSDAGRRRAARLLAGTGVLGGFTTYSALAVECDAHEFGGVRHEIADVPTAGWGSRSRMRSRPWWPGSCSPWRASSAPER